MSKGFVGHLKFENDDCELWHDDKLDLDYITFRSQGLEKVAQFYNEKYHSEGVNIEISKKRNWSKDLTWDIRAQILNAGKSMKLGEAKGFVYVDYAGGFPDSKLEHTRPFILAKDRAGKLIVANFEEAIDKSMYQVRAVSGYLGLQRYNKSCGTFAINVIKNCLLDEDFIKQLFDGSNKDLKFSKKVLVQTSAMFDEALNAEKKEKYLFDKDQPAAAGDQINHKAFYKNVDLMRKIVTPTEWSEFEKLLSAKSKSIVAEIDRRRADFKARNLTGEFVSEAKASAVVAVAASKSSLI